jgi:hypothetical protein
MLEKQQTQLVSCVQKLYQRLRTAGSWADSLSNGSYRHPLVHDILADLDFLKQKSDGGGGVETVNDVGKSSRPVFNASPQGTDGTREAHYQHDSKIDENKSPTQPCENVTSVFSGTLASSNRSRASSMSPLSLNQSFHRTSEVLGQYSTHPGTTQGLRNEAQTESCESQAHPLTILATPIDPNDFNRPTDLLQDYATTPSLLTEPWAISQGSLSQAVVLSTA